MLKGEPREKAEVLQRNLHLQYKRAATENVLITNNLNTGEHLKCIGKPANLIVLLYEHHSIDQRFQNPAGRDYPGEFPSSRLKGAKRNSLKDPKQGNGGLEK